MILGFSFYASASLKFETDHAQLNADHMMLLRTLPLRTLCLGNCCWCVNLNHEKVYSSYRQFSDKPPVSD